VDLWHERFDRLFPIQLHFRRWDRTGCWLVARDVFPSKLMPGLVPPVFPEALWTSGKAETPSSCVILISQTRSQTAAHSAHAALLLDTGLDGNPLLPPLQLSLPEAWTSLGTLVPPQKAVKPPTKQHSVHLAICCLALRLLHRFCWHLWDIVGFFWITDCFLCLKKDDFAKE